MLFTKTALSACFLVSTFATSLANPLLVQRDDVDYAPPDWSPDSLTSDWERIEYFQTLWDLSDNAYCPEAIRTEGIRCQKLPDDRCARIANMTIEFSLPMRADKTSGYVAYSPQWQAIIVAFRGTTQNLKEWMYNFKVTWKDISGPDCPECFVHEGFHSLWGHKDVTNGFRDAIRSATAKYPGATIYYTGHSKGGALAQYALYYTADVAPARKHVIVFGSPMTGNTGFARKLQALTTGSGGVGYSVRFGKDPVTELPFEKWGYRNPFATLAFNAVSRQGMPLSFSRHEADELKVMGTRKNARFFDWVKSFSKIPGIARNIKDHSRYFRPEGTTDSSICKDTLYGGDAGSGDLDDEKTPSYDPGTPYAPDLPDLKPDASQGDPSFYDALEHFGISDVNDDAQWADLEKRIEAGEYADIVKEAEGKGDA